MTKSYISYEKSAKMKYINWFLFLIYKLLTNTLYIVCKQKYKVQSHFTLKTSRSFESMALFHTELPPPTLKLCISKNSEVLLPFK